MIRRTLKLPENKSLFILGPRKTGKSTYLSSMFQDSVYYNLLDTNHFIRLSKEPWLFYNEIIFKIENNPGLDKLPIIIDEIQKIPVLLNEVHRLIEEKNLHFLMSGSSARKLRMSGVNLLGGRAGKVKFNPLSLNEIGDDYKLIDILNRGKLPAIFLADDFDFELQSYVNLYLQEEILAEGAARNLQVFSNFLKVASFSQSEQVNFSNIAREVGIDNRTVKEYFQILEDTLIGNFIYTFSSKARRSDVVNSPKFYFFDTGVANFLRGIRFVDLGGPEFGKSFEHLVYLELKTYIDYRFDNREISYWRTKKGSEVDFIIGEGEYAIEVKSGNLNNADFSSLLEFKDIYKPKSGFVVANIENSRILENGITVYSLRDFTSKLWMGDLI